MSTTRPKRNPLAPTPPALLPPVPRSRAALGLAAAAAAGRFALQRCESCGKVQYPPREICAFCLGDALRWGEVARGGTVLAATTVRISADPYFRRLMPWRTGLVRMDAGPTVVAFLHGALAAEGRARLALRLDKAGQGVILALPEEGTAAMNDDPVLRELGCAPAQRRVLITDGRAPFAAALTRAFLDAGAASVFVGIAEDWRPLPDFAALDDPRIARVPLDASDAEAVHRAAASIGGRVDILVNTTWHQRPGDILDRQDTIFSREEMEAAFFGPMRLAQSFGPAMRSLAGEAAFAPCAWVNILSVAALAPAPGFAAFAAAQAAGLSLAHSLRRELRPLRVVNALVGPLDDVWHEHVPPPKLGAIALARAIVAALEDGIEDLAIGDVAQDILARYRDDPAILLREA
ncbi:MAG: SDR family NAD(P)-dependent oxidoreductase [Rhodospirillales bacterium]|nr:SDR family NAD(P)-dependent oxidoreductase [Rhodospirillales bacterium]MDE2197493.1 SDR family NAD(P)-dependent oxidoreductase [Rhodospirillales bacterium]MDE2574103.1 SDR family NAD(P)-dependent oxidoreductase [Rhodospirillales bacterium]